MKLDFSDTKLLFHLDRLAAWRRGETVTPLLYELSLTDACNSHCLSCPFEKIGRRNRYLSDKIMENLPAQLAEASAKSYFLAGEGEPLLHPGLADFTLKCTALGVEGALSSNGLLFSGRLADVLLETMTWIRFTVMSFNPESYVRLHAVGRDNVRQIRRNIEEASRKRADGGLPVGLGIQQVLVDENLDDTFFNCQTAKELGVDYITIQPAVTQYSWFESPALLNSRYEQHDELIQTCLGLNDDNFKVIFRKQHHVDKREYDRCLGFAFISRVFSDGRVYPCEIFKDDEKIFFGDLAEESLAEIWHSEKTRKLLAELVKPRDFSKCLSSCRMNRTNKFLYDLTCPPPHVNFI